MTASDLSQLELNIMKAVNDLVEKFKFETGFVPSDILINILDVSPHQSSKPEYLIGSVSVKLASYTD